MDPVFLAAAFAMGFLIFRLGLPPLVGFLVAGLTLSALGIPAPAMLSVISDTGVTLLLFCIGLKLKVKNLLKPEVWAGATLHMGLTVALFGFIVFCLGFTGLQYFSGLGVSATLMIAFALSFSSTVFAVKILDDSGRMNSLNGRIAIGVLIIQDVVAVVYLTAATAKMPSPWALLVIGLLPLARSLFRAILSRVGHGELMVLLGIFLALVAGAYAFESVHLKPDIGALIMGMLLAPHPRSAELAEALLSVKELLLVGFFLNIGLMGLPGAAGFAAAAVLILILPFKMILYLLVFTRFRLKARTSFLTTMNLANYSEFGLIVGSMAAANGLISNQWLVVMAIALSASFIVAAQLNRQTHRIYSAFGNGLKRLETRKRHPEEVPFEKGPWEISILGMGRVGAGAYDWFQEHNGKETVGFDFNPETVERQQSQGRKVRQADVTDPDFWRRLQIPDGRCTLIVLAMPEIKTMLRVTEMLKNIGYKGKTAAVAFHDDEVAELLEAGVDAAYNIYAEAGTGLAAHAAETLEPACR